MTNAPIPEHPPGSKWFFDDDVYVIDDRPCDYAGLIPALLRSEKVLIRESDLGVRLHPTTEDR